MSKISFPIKQKFVIALCLTLYAAGSSAVSVVILGNSLSRHGPDLSIGWNGNWGMAASSSALDFKSQFVSILETSARTSVSSKVISASLVEKNFFKGDSFDVSLLPFIDSDTDILVVQIGDNIGYQGISLESLRLRYRQFLIGIKSKIAPSGLFVCLSKWWPNRPFDKVIHDECRANGGMFVDISNVSRNGWAAAATERNFSNPAVGSHPGDRAMLEIAKLIFRALESDLKEKGLVLEK